MSAMAFSTKGIYGWAASIRSIFQKDAPTPITRSTNSSPSDVEMDDGQDASNELSSPSDDDELPDLPPQPTESSDLPQVYQESTMSSDDVHDIMEFFDPTLFESPADYEPQMSLLERMEISKERYPGSKNWAREEERLFEILYLRQDLPMLPPHWNVDFRGFPLPENIFETSDEYPPIIYSHSRNGTKEYAATSAITKVIDLTLDVKTILESANPKSYREQRIVRRRAAQVIKDRLDHLITWASRDGGYDHLQIVPNIVVEVVEASDSQNEVVEWMDTRMRALCQLQNEYYRVDRDHDFWTYTEPRLMGTRKNVRGSLNKRIRAGIRRGHSLSPKSGNLVVTRDRPKSMTTGLAPTGYGGSKRKIFDKPGEMDYQPDRKRRRRTLNLDANGHVSEKPLAHRHKTSVSSTATTRIKIEDEAYEPARKPTEHRREPPVVYGLYVMGTSLFILTADSSKGEDDLYISFQCDINFADAHQSVWNALTLAAVVCAARDSMMDRTEDFEPKEIVYESDPDA